jgi:hypothetical protein
MVLHGGKESMLSKIDYIIHVEHLVLIEHYMALGVITSQTLLTADIFRRDFPNGVKLRWLKYHVAASGLYLGLVGCAYRNDQNFSTIRKHELHF